MILEELQAAKASGDPERLKAAIKAANDLIKAEALGAAAVAQRAIAMLHEYADILDLPPYRNTGIINLLGTGEGNSRLAATEIGNGLPTE